MRRLKTCFLGGLALFAGSLAAPVLATGSCGFERCFGAIAFGPGGATATSQGLRTMPDAHNAAEKSCGNGCRTEVFWNACAAVARSSDGTAAFGWDATLETANAKATAQCEADSDRGGCYVATWACSK